MDDDRQAGQDDPEKLRQEAADLSMQLSDAQRIPTERNVRIPVAIRRLDV